MEYKVIREGSLYRLTKRVKESLVMGWKLQGGIAIGVGLTSDEYLQAMVKEA